MNELILTHSLSQVLQEVSSLRKTFLKKNIEIEETSKPIYPLVLTIKSFLEKEPFSEILFELLVKISRLLYLKSKVLIKDFTSSEDEEIEENITQISEHKPVLNITLPLKGLLWEDIFLPCSKSVLERLKKVEDFEMVEKIDLMALLKAFFSIIKRENELEEVVYKATKVLEEYTEKVKEILQKKHLFSFKKLILQVKEEGSKDYFIEIVYYFLAILFLSFEGVCFLVQERDFEDILVMERR